MTDTPRDPLSPQWEACKVCGGDHWTRDHWAHTTDKKMTTDTPRDPLAALEALDQIETDLIEDGMEQTAAAMHHPLDVLRATLDATRPSGDDLVLVRRDTGGVFPDGTTNHPAIDFDAPNEPTRPSGDEALTRKLHDQRWACSEDRDSCDPAANPAFHDAQLASIGLLSATGLSGYGSISAIAPSGSPSGGSGSPSGDEALRAALVEIIAASEGLRWHIGGKDEVPGWRFLDAVLAGRAALATPASPPTIGYQRPRGTKP